MENVLEEDIRVQAVEKKYDEKSYQEKKLEGLVTAEVDIERGELKLSRKQFDPQDGSEVEPIRDTFLKPTLELRKAELQKELAEVNAKLAEFGV